MLTLQQLAQIMPRAAASGRLAVWYEPLVSEMAANEIVTPARQEMFLAQIAEETGELDVHAETSYFGTPDARILQIFASTGITPAMLAEWRALGRDAFDEAFFNYVYADVNRSPGYGLGNVQPGDGYRYRGRGPMQLTGRGNYERFFLSLGLPPDSDPDLVLQPAIGAKSACHFWRVAGCNELADTGDFTAVVRRVNGGTLNMGARLHYYTAAKAAISGAEPMRPVGLMASKTNIGIGTGVVTTTTIASNAGDMSQPLSDVASSVFPKAMSAMYAPGVIKWVLIGIAVLPLVYVAVRYARKSLRGEVVHT